MMMIRIMSSPKKMPRMMPASCPLLTKSTPLDCANVAIVCTGVPWAATGVGLWGGPLGGGLAAGEGEVNGGMGGGGEGLGDSPPCIACSTNKQQASTFAGLPHKGFPTDKSCTTKVRQPKQHQAADTTKPVVARWT